VALRIADIEDCESVSQFATTWPRVARGVTRLEAGICRLSASGSLGTSLAETVHPTGSTLTVTLQNSSDPEARIHGAMNRIERVMAFLIPLPLLG
jgi:hypothetical protein